jgi:hypothetical protein
MAKHGRTGAAGARVGQDGSGRGIAKAWAAPRRVEGQPYPLPDSQGAARQFCGGLDGQRRGVAPSPGQAAASAGLPGPGRMPPAEILTSEGRGLTWPTAPSCSSTLPGHDTPHGSSCDPLCIYFNRFAEAVRATRLADLARPHNPYGPPQCRTRGRCCASRNIHQRCTSQ